MSRTQTFQSAAAAGAGQWIPVDPYPTSQAGIAIGCFITSGATLTYKVQYTYDSLTNWQPCAISRSTTTATLKLTNHGISGVTDSIVVRNSGDPNLDGVYAVASIVDANNITYTVANTGLAAATATAEVLILRVFDHATITGKSANFDGSVQYPVTALRLNLTAWTSGRVTMIVNEGSR